MLFILGSAIILFLHSTADILVREGIRARNSNHWETAALRFEDAARINLHSFDALFYRSWLALEQGQFAVSLDYADRALVNMPHSFDALHIKGLALEKLHRNDKAAEIFQQVLSLFPPHEGAQTALPRVSNAKNS